MKPDAGKVQSFPNLPTKMVAELAKLVEFRVVLPAWTRGCCQGASLN